MKIDSTGPTSDSMDLTCLRRALSSQAWWKRTFLIETFGKLEATEIDHYCWWHRWFWTTEQPTGCSWLRDFVPSRELSRVWPVLMQTILGSWYVSLQETLLLGGGASQAMCNISRLPPGLLFRWNISKINTRLKCLWKLRHGIKAPPPSRCCTASTSGYVLLCKPSQQQVELLTQSHDAVSSVMYWILWDLASVMKDWALVRWRMVAVYGDVQIAVGIQVAGRDTLE